MKPIPVIDNGHGGIINGQYQTKGKRFTFPDGTTIHEGEFNRAITSRVIEGLYNKGIPYYVLVPELIDVPLKERVKRADRIYKENDRNTFLVSIHSNAGGGYGCEAFICNGASSNSRRLAQWTQILFKHHFPYSRWRGIKTKNFTMIKRPLCPAILIECFFMDMESECKKYLKTKQGRDKIAAWIIDIIETFREL
jgi:N-acetylmuramoyl-L-alanine amidase